MAWNTAQMQKVLDHWAQRRGGTVPPELVGRVAPSRTEGINLRGVFRFRALRRENPSVCGCRENDGPSVVKRAEDAKILRFCQDQNAPDNSTTCAGTPRDSRETWLPATVCYCTENERTPGRAAIRLCPTTESRSGDGPLRTSWSCRLLDRGIQSPDTRPTRLALTSALQILTFARSGGAF